MKTGTAAGTDSWRGATSARALYESSTDFIRKRNNDPRRPSVPFGTVQARRPVQTPPLLPLSMAVRALMAEVAIQ
jgi:hypothetical protein